MSTTSDLLAKQARKVTTDLQEMGGTVRDAAEGAIGRVGESATETYQQGRDKVQDAARIAGQLLRERPFQSVLIAAGIGWLFGRFWKRR